MLKEKLGEELYNQVMEKLGDTKIMVDDGNFIPKSRFDEVNNQKKELKDQVDNLNKTIESTNKDFEKFKKSAEMTDELKKQLEDYQTKLATAQTDFTVQLKTKEEEWTAKETRLRKLSAVKEKFLVEGAKSNYIDLILDKVDMDKIIEADGKFIGIDDIAKSTKETYADLFNSTKVVGTGVSGNTGNTGGKETLEALYKKAMETRSQEDIEAYSKAKLEQKE